MYVDCFCCISASKTTNFKAREDLEDAMNSHDLRLREAELNTRLQAAIKEEEHMLNLKMNSDAVDSISSDLVPSSYFKSNCNYLFSTAKGRRCTGIGGCSKALSVACSSYAWNPNHRRDRDSAPGALW